MNEEYVYGVERVDVCGEMHTISTLIVIVWFNVGENVGRMYCSSSVHCDVDNWSRAAALVGASF